ncbi:acetyl-CoA acetyltransferase [Diabrotica virgifera virgifera]|uniref:Acetyl-CoA acetyltransferase, cytosolic n=1 Tax=Diabrotica virgifera virgifera TaxID=50390 RepID=A0ABM5K0M3_DIAVI|nr:acetyl-CoA acetyltransferase [Diabrotica virgifera virgifera]
MSDVYIVAACRTPIGSFNGQFEKHSAVELGTVAIAEAVKRANLQPQDVDQVIMGQVLTAGQGQNPARQAALGAKIPICSSAYTLNLLCGSGLKTVAIGYQGIKNGDYEIIVAGGQENMTRAEHSAYIRNAKMGNLNLADTLFRDGLHDAFTKDAHMGVTAENVVQKYNISREAQDAFACESQNRTEKAVNQGAFEKEIVGVPDKKTGHLITKDEFPKFGTTVEKLAEYRGRFVPNGTVTAGNASGINDGAAAVVLVSEKQVKQRQLKPLARIVGYAEAGCDPMIMGMGPVGAVNNLLKKIGWTKDEVDLYELNEAYAGVSIAVNNELGVDPSKVNVAGGSLSLGHPLGCSGTRVLVTLIYNLQRLNLKKGVASLCIGGGMGIALAVEVLN